MNNLKFIDGIGFIPNDWAVKRADELCSKITKGTTPPKEDIVNNSNIPFLRVNNLTFDGLLDVNSSFIFVSEVAHRSVLSRSIAYKNDILMNIVGPPLGKTALLNDSFDEYNLNQAIVIYRVSSTDVARLFFFFFLKGVIAQNWLQSHSKKTSGQQNLTIEVCKNLPVPIPPLSEQIKIASILSTWDNAINTVQKLLANSQQQKIALMQQLLTGKKRFSGFEGEWEEKRLGDISDMNSGGTPKSSVPEFYNGDFPWVSIADMTKQGKFINFTERYITGLGIENSSARLYPKNTILYAMYASIGESSIANVECCSSQAILGIRTRKELYYEFLYFYLCFLKEEIKLQGQQGTQSNLNAGMVKDFKIKLPSLPEQQKIATILTTADQEIDNLRAQLNHLKQEKKALMQQLLTGKRRVKVEEAA